MLIQNDPNQRIQTYFYEACIMSQRREHRPGEPAPAAGTYEQVNIFGRPTGIRVDMDHGHPLPAAPIGHSWVPADEGGADC